MLHYFVKNFFTEVPSCQVTHFTTNYHFNKVLVSSYSNDTVYFVKAVNDLPKDITGVINVAIYAFEDSSIVKKLSQLVKVPALGRFWRRRMILIKLNDSLSNRSCECELPDKFSAMR